MQKNKFLLSGMIDLAQPRLGTKIVFKSDESVEVKPILYKKKVVKIASKNPIWVADTDAALSAINIMNARSITSLLVSKKRY